MKRELGRLGTAAQDPAVTFLVLLPLGLLHLSGRDPGASGAFSLVEVTLSRLGQQAFWALAAGLALALCWSIGRIRAHSVAWRGGAVLAILEGCVWGWILGPVLGWLTSWIHLRGGPLLLPAGLGETHASLALAAGAGLYEEVLFRAALLGGGTLGLRALFRGLGWGEAAPALAFALALLLSSAVFSWAHALGDPDALDPEVFTFRAIAGGLLGLLWAGRGLAVTAYAHTSYDAFLMMGVLG